ncbi:lytic transglycosylase domain-containing protein [Brevundimonas sp.]|uniref:lytic transglycosylase domain-containing protein n=1 Tax=Brevundimonas sp. TaxID=1871086 RepID=UPI001A2C896A|nr:lytic transglycosylase domain-containing protein [Brevundimonas sp.]MBJ7483477.1 lytic transglycosylase domain-containing protein [Brevundimonas sp.]
MLDLALVLALSTQCAPGVSPRTMAAIAHAESRFDPLAIGVNGRSAVRQPRTRDEAINTARHLIDSGASIDLGLAQINSANLAWLGLTVEDTFDPCRNLAAAATVLRAGFRPASDRVDDRQHALRVALSRYNTGHPERGFRNGYVARVEASGVRLGLSDPTVAVGSGPEGPVEPVMLAAGRSPQAAPPAWDVFARAAVSPATAFPPAAQNQTRSVVP